MALEGTRLWLADPTESFVEAEVVRQLPDGTLVVRETATRKEKSLKSHDELHFCNPDIEGGYPDMTSLNHLNEAAILYNLRFRFKLDTVYTYCGRTCIAVNPFKWLDLYSANRIKQYHDGDPEHEPPHIFAVAESAYRLMCKHQKNQSILVSGESGAGKTETTKLLLKYLAQVAHTGNQEITDRVLQSNPLLEAFGNAKTVRNDNSSRFGKFIELQFNSDNHVIGASIQTYLLEKSRVVYLSPKERNYHIFYQLIAGADSKLRGELSLSDNPNTYHYLNQSSCMTLDDVSDAEGLRDTKKAMSVIGISESDISSTFKIIAGILHLGQIRFVTRRRQEEAASVENPNDLECAAKVLQVSPEKLTECLCFRRIVAMNETYSSPNNIQQATSTRDALAKFLYGRLFDWLVERINQQTRQEKLKKSFIGILDIFGFECFEKNSFEQLCINYANEKLQQQYTQDIFKTVQDEYAAEKIPWSFVDFVDNQECLNLLESKMGLISLLNEECMIPKGTDTGLLNKLQTIVGTNKYFQKEKLGNESFSVHHFAGKVTYSVASFLEKNKDTLVPDIVAAMSTSTDQLIKMLATTGKAVESGGKAAREYFLASQFKSQLTSLMTTIQSTNVHYIRCIKPNIQNKPGIYQNIHVSNQLRYAGVLEAIRISRAAFPNRLHHDEFFERFKLLLSRPLGSKRPTNAEKLKIIQNILAMHFDDPTMYQVGITRIYFRYGRLEELEKLRAAKLSVVIVKLQKTIRMWLKAVKYRRFRKAVIKAQAQIRMHIHFKRYNKTRQSIVLIQSIARMMIATKLVNKLRRWRAAMRIQKSYRGYVQRRQYKSVRKAFIRLQAIVRMRRARKKFLVQLQEAREAAKLENQLSQLQKRLQQEMAARNDLEREKQELEARLKTDEPEEIEMEETYEEEIAHEVPITPRSQATRPPPKIIKKIVRKPREKPKPVTKTIIQQPTTEPSSDVLNDMREMMNLLQSEIERVTNRLAQETSTVKSLQATNKKLETQSNSQELKVQVDTVNRRPLEHKYQVMVDERNDRERKLRHLLSELQQIKTKYRNEVGEYDRIKKEMSEVQKDIDAATKEQRKIQAQKKRLDEEKGEMKSMMKFESIKTSKLKEKLHQVLTENRDLIRLSGQQAQEYEAHEDGELPTHASTERRILDKWRRFKSRYSHS